MPVVKGKFIVIEGIDGSGKTSQINRLGAYFAENNIPCFVTKEPSDRPIGNLARQAVCGGGKNLLSADALALLFAADRAEHLNKEIRPALAAGKVVLCDRFIYSNMAYQGMAVPMWAIASYNERFIKNTEIFEKPDLTIFIDTPPEECTRRIIASRESFELFDGAETAQKIRSGYFEAFELCKAHMPVTVIDGNRSKNEIFSRLSAIINPLLI
jgi:dTMP kinase